MKILDFGSLNLDRVYKVEEFVKPGQTIQSLRMDTFCGGKGLNQAIAAKKAGADVYMAGKIGTDGEILLNKLEKFGVNCDNVIKQTDVPSGHAIIQVDKTGQNSIILYGGANRTVNREDADKILAKFSKGDILLLQNEISCLDYIIDTADKMGMTIALNPSPIDDNLLKCSLSKVDYFIMNEIEAAQIRGVKNTNKALDVLRNTYPDAKLVITKGCDGADYFDGESLHSFGVYDVTVVDTTGAGDTFTGYFLSGIINGLSSYEILRNASKASGIAVSKPGAADSIPEMDAVINSKIKIKFPEGKI
jgi:ribokinase